MPQNVSRREALKRLVTLMGSTALTTLPDQWTEPIVVIGRLPIYALVSPLPPLRRTLVAGLNNCDAGGGPNSGTAFTISFDYDDPAGQVTLTGSRLLYTYQFQPTGIGGLMYDGDLTDPLLNVSGDRFRGTISLDICTGFGGATGIIDTISLTNALGRTFTLSHLTAAPVGAHRVSGQASSQRPL